jgi:mono/diheme cytochrome c family protein
MIEQYVSAAELRRLLASLMVVIGAILIFALFAFLVVPGMRNANRPTAAEGEPSQGDMGWLDPTDYPATRGYDIPPLDPKEVLTPTPVLVDRGRALFSQNCAACHGEAGRGNGPASTGLRPAPRDFSAAIGWKNGTGLAGIFRTLRNGVPGSAMLPYDFLTKRDRIALAHHVRTLAPSPLPDDRPDARAAFEKELAAPGERVPNRIPVGLAGKRLVDEYTPAPPLAPDAQISPLLRRALQDPARAATVLAASTEWRQSPQQLARSLTIGVPANGFRAELATYTTEEWRALWTELLRTPQAARLPGNSARGTTR